VKKTFLILLSILLLALNLSACAKINKSPLHLPTDSDIESIKISHSGSDIELSDSKFIAEIIAKANSAGFTNKKSVQDYPSFPEMIQIDFTDKSGNTTTLFVYEHQNKWYIEQPYQGIYTTDNELVQMLTVTAHEFALAPPPSPSAEVLPAPVAETPLTPKSVWHENAGLAEEEPYIPEASEIAASLGITAENYPRIDSSTTTLPLVQAIYTNMFQPTEEYSYPKMPREASKTMKSYDMLLDSEVDLILVPDPSQDILNKVSESGIELEYIPIGCEALVFITHKDNPAQNVTQEQILEIYTSMTVNNWSQLGGEDGRIVPICRNVDAGSQAQMDNFILKGEEMAPEIKENHMMYDMGNMLIIVWQYEQIQPGYGENDYAIGYTMYYYIDIAGYIMGAAEIKPLALDGIEPTPETIASKEYPLATSYYAVMRKDTPETHSARKIADWLLSPEGQWEVNSSGLGALKPMEWQPEY